MKLRLLALMVAVFLVAAACADTTGSAIEVNGEAIPRGDVVDVLAAVARDVAELENVQPELKTPYGSISSGVSATVLTSVVLNEVLRQALSAEALGLTESEIETAKNEFAGGSGSAVFDDLQAEFIARGTVAQSAGLDVNDVLANAVVEIDPRFGRWDAASAQVVPNSVPSS